MFWACASLLSENTMLTKDQILDDRRYWLGYFGDNGFRRIARRYNIVALSFYELVFAKKKKCDIRENFQMLAIDKDDALKYAGILLRIKGKVTRKRFRKAGGEAILFKGEQIFPKKK